MPTARVNGVRLSYEVTGRGFPLVFSHEFAGDCRSWEPQVRFFSRRYQVITYNHRGYPPSEAPEDPEAYTQDHLVEDLHGLLRHLRIPQAHVCGLSMGGGVAVNFAMAHPEMARSIVAAGTGTGTTRRQQYLRDLKASASLLLEQGMEAFAEVYSRGPGRQAFMRKDPRGWKEFKRLLAGHSAKGSAYTFLGVQRRRPTIYQLEARLQKLAVPTLIICGDEDEPCIEPSVFMKRHIPGSGLAMFPQTGHTLNLEEPDLFNRTVLDFLTAVEAGRWATRDVTGDLGYMLPPGAAKRTRRPRRRSG
jgi:pimeloyl-ACP methyl ester carboxylesterase